MLRHAMRSRCCFNGAGPRLPLGTDVTVADSLRSVCGSRACCVVLLLPIGFYALRRFLLDLRKTSRTMATMANVLSTTPDGGSGAGTKAGARTALAKSGKL